MPKLYVVGTPIGNLSDFSERGRQTLCDVDFIAAEDTRVTLKLLNRFDIKKSLVSYHEHNKAQMGEAIVERIENGESCALVTDAGMPAISDPGEDLVRLCHERGVEVESVPGPCAFTTALALSGMKTRRFVFEGFLPGEKKEKEQVLFTLKNEERTIVLYEAPHRLLKTLRELYENLGERKIAIVKEITKIHESVLLLTLSAAIEKYSTSEPKGEFVIIIEGKEKGEGGIKTLEEAVNYARELMNDGESRSNAAKIAAKESGFKKGDIYAQLGDRD